MPAGGFFLPLPFQGTESLDHPEAGLAGFDHVIDAHVLGQAVRVGKDVPVLPDFFLEESGRIRRGLEFPTVEKLGGLFRSHDGELGSRPGIGDIGSMGIMPAHGPVPSPVSFAEREGHFGDG